MFIRSSTAPKARGGSGPSALVEVLHDLRLAGVAFARCELRGAWGLEFVPDGFARFHFVAEGNAALEVRPGKWIELEVGDVVLLPRGDGHAMADRPRRRTRPIESVERREVGERVVAVHEGRGVLTTRLFCGSVDLGTPALHPLVAAMPRVLRVSDFATRDALVRPLLDAMADEVRTVRVGDATMLVRLAELVIARLVRAWAETEPRERASGWLGAIRDPQLGRAMAAVHADPGAAWSVQRLAREAHLSRSGFSQRFTQTLGVSPARYVAQLRMRLAREWLAHDRVRVGEAAARLGYDSVPSFSRAFKREMGVFPSALRAASRRT